ncbi:MAG TPA: hypothetical protein VD859_13425 [Nocardioides sp.]|nr:hypothetical protein [Nocardioides sp.]
MPDLDQLLSADRGAVMRAAADAAHLPDFADVAARGRRRRNTRNGVVLGVAALATATLVGAVQLIGGGSSGEVAPAGTDTPSPSVDRTARDDEQEARDDGQLGEHIVDDEQALPIDVAASGEDVRATLWRSEDGIALSVVDDAGDWMRTTAEVPAGTTVWPATDARFVVVEGGDPEAMTIVHRDGYGIEVDADAAEGPVGEAEVVVAVGTELGEYGAYAVDVDAATAHPVDLPVDDPFRVDVFGDRIVAQQSVGNTAEVVVHWSDDGSEWHFAPTTAGTRHLVVPAAEGDPILLETADGADPAPLDAVHVLDGEEFERTEYTGDVPALLAVPYDEPGDVGFFYGEEVRVFATLWGQGENIPREAGLFAWTGFDLDHLTSGAPEFTDDEDPGVVSVEFEDGAPVLWISGADGTLFRSDDGGASFDQYDGR